MVNCKMLDYELFKKSFLFYSKRSHDPIELVMTLTSAMEGRNLDLPDIDGKSPLHYAADKGATVCCIHLLQQGADINRTDLLGNTPLALAIKQKHERYSKYNFSYVIFIGHLARLGSFWVILSTSKDYSGPFILTISNLPSSTLKSPL